jgi:hypothetical protein
MLKDNNKFNGHLMSFRDERRWRLPFKRSHHAFLPPWLYNP